MYKKNVYFIKNTKKEDRKGCLGSNLDNTNGINAAVVRLFSELTLSIVHQYIRSSWSPIASEPEPVWRSNIDGADVRERLFRYDDRGPDEIFRHGFSPRLNPNSANQFTWDLHDHVAGGDNPRSVYVSTTRTLTSSDGEIAVWQPDIPLDQDIDIQYVYEIFAPGGIDVNASYGSNSPFMDEHEIAFPGGIRPEYIRSVRHVVYERNTDNQIPRLLQITMNPFFLCESDLPDVILPKNTKIVMWDNSSSQKEKDELINDKNSYTDFMKSPGSTKPDPFKNDPNNHRRLADGEYTIKTGHNKNYVIDMPKTTEGTNVILYQTNSQLHQKWNFTYDKKRDAYKIKSSKAMVELATDGSKVSVWAVNNNSDHFWRIESMSVGFLIRNVKYPDKVLDLKAGENGVSNRQAIQLYDQTIDEKFIMNQRWLVHSVPPTQTIPDGEYVIKTSRNENYVIDMPKSTEGTNVILYQTNSQLHQKWNFTYDKKQKAYKIKSSKAMVELATDGNEVSVWAVNNNSDHFWRIENSNQGFFIRNVKYPDKVLDLEGGENGVSNHQTIKLYNQIIDENYIMNQRWLVHSVPSTQTIPDGEYVIKTSRNENFVLDMPKTTEGTNVILYQTNSQPHQKWNFTYDKKQKAYKIKSSKAMVELATDGNEVSVWAVNNNSDHFWRIENSNQGFFIRNVKYPDKVLDLEGGENGVSNHQTIKLYNQIIDENYIMNQRWYLGQISIPIVQEGLYHISTKLNYKKLITNNLNNHDIEISNWILSEHLQDWELKYDIDRQAYKIYTKFRRWENLGLSYQNEGFRVTIEPIDIDSNNLRVYWLIEFNQNKGGYLIRSLYEPNQVFDLTGSNITNWTKIITYHPTLSDNQLWYLIPIKSS